MGITVLTLALASVRREPIPDHRSGAMVHVKVLGRTPKSVRYPNGHPDYVLEYANGVQCSLKYEDGQGVAGDEISS